MQEIYRSAASIVLLRPATRPDDVRAVAYQVLLIHKPRKRDAWQLPQGGVEEGESVVQAALRELHEEAGVADVTVLGSSKNFYQYDFPASYRKFRPDHVRGQRIQYVYGLAKAGTEVTVDQQEIDQHVWVFPDEVKRYIKRKEYLRLADILIEEALHLANKHISR